MYLHVLVLQVCEPSKKRPKVPPGEGLGWEEPERGGSVLS